jgi:hypothetical protein
MYNNGVPGSKKGFRVSRGRKESKEHFSKNSEK